MSAQTASGSLAGGAQAFIQRPPPLMPQGEGIEQGAGTAEGRTGTKEEEGM
jgi:hypothetical protein